MNRENCLVFCPYHGNTPEYSDIILRPCAPHHASNFQTSFPDYFFFFFHTSCCAVGTIMSVSRSQLFITCIFLLFCSNKQKSVHSKPSVQCGHSITCCARKQAYFSNTETILILLCTPLFSGLLWKDTLLRCPSWGSCQGSESRPQGHVVTSKTRLISQVS